MKKNTIVNKIANYVRQEISHSNLKSNHHIKESDIAKKFKISRVPVREAFRILQSEGYLEVIPHRGSFVKKISKAYTKEKAIVYKLLAPVVLREAIPRYKAQTYKKADEIIHKLETCTEFYKLGYLLWDFAKVIYGPSNMKYILCLFDEMYLHGIRILNEIFEIKLQRYYDISDHKKFIELCKMKKTDEAIELWSDYIDRTVEISLRDVTNIKKVASK
ncbi:MAG: GntR family transcriptional regulator [Ignavibacteria bacterium]